MIQRKITITDKKMKACWVPMAVGRGPFDLYWAWLRATIAEVREVPMAPANCWMVFKKALPCAENSGLRLAKALVIMAPMLIPIPVM